MPAPEAIRARCNFYGILLIPVGLTLTVLLVGGLYVPVLTNLRPALLYGLLIMLCAGIGVALLLWREGIGTASRPLLLLGFINLFGGAAFDMIATVIHTPSLSLELNPIVRVMQNSGFSLDGIYAYAVVAQTLLQTLFFVIWAAFLRHKTTVIALAWAKQPENRRQFMRAALNNEGVTLFTMLTGAKSPPGYHRRVYYHQLALAAILLQFLGAYRWYLGLLAFQIVPFSLLPLVGGGLFIGGLVAYRYWLSSEYDKGQPAAVSPASASPQLQGDFARFD